MPRFDEPSDDLTVGKIVKIVTGLVIGLIALIAVFSTFYTVGAGERGIVLTWGNPSMNAMGPGLHMKIPFAQHVVKMDVQTQKYDADASAASSDLQIVSTKIAVNYHLTPESVPALYKDIGVTYREKVIQPAVQEVVKACTAKSTAEQLITQRANVKECIDVALKERLLDKGINMETTSITNFDFSAQFNSAIEAKVTAEQEALTQKNKLAQKEYEAQQAVAIAKGQADATVLNAEAEAKKIELIQAQLAASPNYVELIKAQKWSGNLPVIVMGGNGATPFLDISSIVSTGVQNGATTN